MGVYIIMYCTCSRVHYSYLHRNVDVYTIVVVILRDSYYRKIIVCLW